MPASVTAAAESLASSSSKRLKVTNSLHHPAWLVEASIHVCDIGNLHCAPGTVTSFGGNHIHNVNPFNMRGELEKFHADHQVNKLSFGPTFPGMVRSFLTATVNRADSTCLEKPSSRLYFLGRRIGPTQLFLGTGAHSIRFLGRSQRRPHAPVPGDQPHREARHLRQPLDSPRHGLISFSCSLLHFIVFGTPMMLYTYDPFFSRRLFPI